MIVINNSSKRPVNAFMKVAIGSLNLIIIVSNAKVELNMLNELSIKKAAYSPFKFL